MVKKLLKYEALYYRRSLLPVFAALLGVGCLTRFVQIFETDSIAYDILFGAAVFAQAVATFACTVLTVWQSVRRFYQNLFKSEGYLTFTLPVTHTQILLSKLLAVFLVDLIEVAVIFLSIAIATAGDVFVELMRFVGYCWKRILELTGWQGWLFAGEIVVLLALLSVTSLLLFYACICVGQMAKKNKGLAAVGAYFVWYFVGQIAETVLTIVFTVVLAAKGEELGVWIMNHFTLSVHLGLGIAFVIALLLASLYWTVCRLVMRHRLNLE